MSDFATKASADNKLEPTNNASICPAILEDHAFIKEDLPKAAILTLTQQFVTVIIMRTPYSRVQLRIQVKFSAVSITNVFASCSLSF
jgi:hypothetical protein